MRYGSVCSGIEAATVAWHALGWTPAWFSEIEPFPCAVLAHHYPTVPNLGDMTRIGKDAGPIDLLVGGTPCQSFSVAGLRKGLADPRGNLALVFLRLVDELRPRWVVWENVPGVLSSGGGRDFGSFLGGLVELGYGFAYRVLDAQYIRVESHARAVPQRRRRVFVVGHLGDWRRAGAVLLERESLCGHPAPRREAGQGTTGTLSARPTAGGGLGTDFDCGGGLIPEVCGTLSDGAHMGGGLNGQDAYTGRVIPVAQAFDWQSGGDSRGLDPRDTAQLQSCQVPAVCHSLKADGFDASEDGTGRGTPLVPVSAINLQVATRHKAMGESTGLGIGGQDDPAFTLQREHSHGVIHGMAVRRLTPRECERLQGFPDSYTAVPYRRKPAADGPRYRALGNSMAVNCMAWIGQRIAQMEPVHA